VIGKPRAFISTDLWLACDFAGRMDQSAQRRFHLLVCCYAGLSDFAYVGIKAPSFTCSFAAVQAPSACACARKGEFITSYSITRTKIIQQPTAA
jgi:hypothetical protein